MKSQTSTMICTDCIGRCKSNYHTIAAIETPRKSEKFHLKTIHRYKLSPFSCEEKNKEGGVWGGRK